MKKTEFNKLLESIQLLNNGQFRQVKELINNIESINFVSTELETPTFEICCGHCKSNNFRRWGKQSDLQRYETIDVIFNQNRNLEIYNSILESLNQQTLSKSLSEIYSKDSLLLSNNNKEIQIFSFKFNINHIDCNSNQEKNYIHTTNINSYCLNMLLWLKRFRGVATKYLDNYLSWYRELDELGKCITPNIVLIRAKSGDLYKKQL